MVQFAQGLTRSHLRFGGDDDQGEEEEMVRIMMEMLVRKYRMKRLADEKDQHMHAMDGDDGHNTEASGAHSQARAHQGTGELELHRKLKSVKCKSMRVYKCKSMKRQTCENFCTQQGTLFFEVL